MGNMNTEPISPTVLIVPRVDSTTGFNTTSISGALVMSGADLYVCTDGSTYEKCST